MRTWPHFSNGMEYGAASMRVRYTLRARGDLEAIYNFLDECNPTVAQSVKDLIEYRIAGLADFPYKARFNKETGVYELTIVRFPYIVYYEVVRTQVWIIHIRHTSREEWEGENHHRQ